MPDPTKVNDAAILLETQRGSAIEEERVLKRADAGTTYAGLTGPTGLSGPTGPTGRMPAGPTGPTGP